MKKFEVCRYDNDDCWIVEDSFNSIYQSLAYILETMHERNYNEVVMINKNVVDMYYSKYYTTDGMVEYRSASVRFDDVRYHVEADIRTGKV